MIDTILNKQRPSNLNCGTFFLIPFLFLRVLPFYLEFHFLKSLDVGPC